MALKQPRPTIVMQDYALRPETLSNQSKWKRRTVFK